MGQASQGLDDLRVVMCICFKKSASLDDIRKFKRAIIECPHVLHSLEASGSFDFMFEAAVSDLAIYQELLDSLTPALAPLAENHAISFVCKRYRGSKPLFQSYNIRKMDNVWVPCRNGRKRVSVAQVDKITAERDYVRIHIDGSSYLLHCTIKNMVERLSPSEFVHIHRSIVVRRDRVERLLHEGTHWLVRMTDGSVHPISKSHQKHALEAIQGALML
jgi:DNA-binding LytR/AlgR family response regulator